MPGQNINFKFTGDTSGLGTAINSAIRMLDRYKNAAGSTSSNISLSSSLRGTLSTLVSMQQRIASFKQDMQGMVSDKSMNTFEQKFQQVSDTITHTAESFKDMGEMGFTQSEAELTTYLGSVQKLDDMLGRLTERTEVNSQQMGAYSTNVKRLNNELVDSAGAFVVAMNNTSKWRQELGLAQTTIENVKQRFRDMFQAFTLSAQNFKASVTVKILQVLQSVIAKAKEIRSNFVDVASRVGASFSHMVSSLGNAAQTMQRLIYKTQNYDRVLKEVNKNQQAYIDYELKLHDYEYRKQRAEKLLPFATNDIEARQIQKSVGRKPKEVELLSEDQIIDKMMSSGTGKGFNFSFSKFTRMLRPMQKAMNSVMKVYSTIGGTASNIFKRLGSAIVSATKSFGAFNTRANVTTQGLRGMLSVARELPSIFTTLASNVLQISFGNILAEGTSLAIEMVENLNLFTVSMGIAADEAKTFTDTMSEMYGMNPSNLYRYAGYFAQITGAIGLTDTAAMKLSTSMTKMANDMASLYNLEIEQVVENLGSGLQGLNQAVRKYGIDMRQTTIQQTAYQYGLTENVATMTEANRVVLRYLTMLQQMRNAIKQTTDEVDGSNRIIGDFARNIETPANQLRILKEQVQQLAVAVGTFLIPVVQKLLPILNGVIAAIRMILQFFAQLFGIDALSWGGEISAGANLGADGLGDLEDAADSAGKKMKDLLAPFDELHILNEQLGTDSKNNSLDDWGTLDPRLLEALEELQLQLDNVRLKAWDVRDAILAIFGLTPDLELIPGGFIDNLQWFANEGNWREFGAEIARFFNQGIDWALENITWEKLGGKITEVLQTVADIFNGFITGFNWYGLGNIAANLTNILFNTIHEAVALVEWDTLGFQLSQYLNGLFLNIDWVKIFDTLADGFNQTAMMLYGFIESLRLEEIVSKIVEGINAGVDTFEPELLAIAIAEYVRKGVAAVAILVENIKLDELVNKMFAAITRFVYELSGKLSTAENTWSTLGATLVNGIQRAIHSIATAIRAWGDMGITQATIDFLKGAIAAINPEQLRADIQTIINQLIGMFAQFRNEMNVRKMTTEFILWLDETLKGIHVSELMHTITGFVNDLIGGVVDAFKIQKKSGGTNLIHEFFTWIQQLFDDFPWGDIGYIIGNWVGELIAHVIDFFTGANFVSFVFGFVNGIVDAFNAHPEAWQVIKDKIAWYLVAIVAGIPPVLAGPLSTLAAWLGGVVRNWISSFFDGIGQWVQGFFTNLGGIILESLGGLISLLPGKLGELGKTLEDYGTQLRKNAHTMMDTAFDGIQDSIDINSPEVINKFSQNAQEMVNKADEKFAQLPVSIAKYTNQMSEVSRTTLSQMNSMIAQMFDDLHTDTNDTLKMLIADVEGHWHEIEVGAETTWNDVYTTISTEMRNSSEEVATQSELIRTTMISKIQSALADMKDLEWEQTGVDGILKLKGGIETAWGNLDIFIDEKTGQIIAAIENTLDNPSYSMLATNLVNNFTSVFTSITNSAANMWTKISSYMNKGADAVSALNKANQDAEKAWIQIQNITQTKLPASTQPATGYNGNTNGAAATASSVLNNVSTYFKNAQEALGSGKYTITTRNGQTYYQNPDGSIGRTWSTVGQKFFAQGGVVTRPTNAVIGEGNYSEAVLPLDNSPQMRQLVDAIADAVNSGGRGTVTQAPIEMTVKVQIGDSEWDTFVYESSQRGQKNVGGNPVEVTS